MAEDWRNDPALDAAVGELERVPEVRMEAAGLSRFGLEVWPPPEDPPPTLAERLGKLWRTVAEHDGNWLKTGPGEPAWLLRRDGVGWLRRGIVGMLVGGGGTGKTMAALQLAVAVAAAGEGEAGERAPQWFGVDVCGGAREGVLVLLGEEPEEEAHRRCWRAAEALKLSDAQRAAAGLRLMVLPLAGEAPALRLGGVGVVRAETPLVDVLKRLLKKPPPGCDRWSLVVVDPLSRFGGPDAEVDNAAATELVTTLEALRVAAGSATLILVHHKGKAELREGGASQTGARGASALVDGARWVCDMSRERLPAKKPDEKKGESWSEREVKAIQAGRRVLLEVVKSNYSLPGPPLRLEVADEGEGVPAGALVRAKYQNQTEALEAAAERASDGKAAVVAAVESMKSRRDL